MNLKNLEKTLKDLKDNKIFDYETKSIYYKVFTSFNEKKEAIDFLIKKKTDINYLKEKLDPTIKSISISMKDIEDVNECLNHFKKLNLDSSEIIRYISE
jgi:hypothetical protein